MDSFTKELFKELYSSPHNGPAEFSNTVKAELENLYQKASAEDLTQPIIDFFLQLRNCARENGIVPTDLGYSKEQLEALAAKHSQIDEHGVTVGGRLNRALPIASEAGRRTTDYLARKDIEAPSGIQLWETIQQNIHNIQNSLGMTDENWQSYTGQLKFAIDKVETLAKIINLPDQAVKEVLQVTQSYRMRLTPYYASLIMPEKVNDPVLLQSVPTGEMIDNIGEEIPPVAADHSPARLIDQFYPRVVTIKATNMCAMYCTHCLRIAHIGKKDRIYAKSAYREALDYIRRDPTIRDLLITGGDAFVLPNDMLRWLLSELDTIDHVTVKRLGTRIPVTAPMRIDNELLDIIGASNDMKPVRVVTQINTAQEITPVSREGFRKLAKCTSALLNQAVLMKGINDTQVKMWKLCETIQEAYVRPYYIFNCSYRNPQFAHLRVPVEVGRDIVESMYGNISGDAIPRFIATAGGKIPLHRDNVVSATDEDILLRKPWSGEEVKYPDANPEEYHRKKFAFAKY